MTSTTTYPTAEGERRKLEAFALLEARRETLINRGRRALLAVMLNGNGTATADDVRAAVTVPAGIDPVALGAVPGALARAGIIRRSGFRTSDRPEAHVRPVSVWSLTDRNAALTWLRDHPDRPNPVSEPPIAADLFGGMEAAQ
ncbi:MAG TPA: hypothetical protein VHP11_10010 [Tepidisphaeraceae bacterium]|nr:hypothetical protein [Tepidisphaeraceae bacterium]